MNGWKDLGCLTQPATRHVKYWLTLSVLLPLCGWNLFTPIAYAQDGANRITDISVSPNGELVLQVEGEGFDPILRMEPLSNGEYRIIVLAEGVRLSPNLSQATARFNSALIGKIPAVEKASLNEGHTANASFTLVVTSWRKLQPQVSSNSGNQIVISLLGDRSLPPAVAQRRQQVEQQRLAAIHKQEELEKQAALQQDALQKEALKKLAIQKQVEAQQMAHRKAEAEKQRLADTRSRGAITQQSRLPQKMEQQRLVQGPNSINPITEEQMELDEDQQDFDELKQREAQRLAEHQKQMLAHFGQNPPQVLEAPQPSQQHATEPIKTVATVKPTVVANRNPSKTGTKQAHLQNIRQLANKTPNQRTTVTVTRLPNANPDHATEQANDWQHAYIAQKPMSTEEFLTELQVAQPAAKPEKLKNIAQQAPAVNSTSSAPNSTQTPATQLAANPTANPATDPGTTHMQDQLTRPVNFNGPNNGSNSEDNAPTDPLRLKKLPPNYAPEPDPYETPMNFRPGNDKNTCPSAGQCTTPHLEIVPQALPPGSDAGTLQGIYAVINQPNADPELKLAWQSLMGGNAPSAINALRQHLQRKTDDDNARYLLAQILLSPMAETPNGNPTLAAQEQIARREEARQLLLKNYAQSLHWPSCQALLEMFLDEGKLIEANRLMVQVEKAYPKESGVAYEQGRLQEAQNNLDAARQAYQKALALQADNPEIHYRLAQVELKNGHLEAARWELLQALAWSPNDSRLYKLLGYIADKTGQSQQAAKAYRQALPVDALLTYAHTLETQNQPDRALSLYQAVETLAGDNGDILYNLAMIYNNSHRPTRAAAVLQRFLSLNATSHDTRVAKAKFLLQQLDHQR